MTPLRPTIRRRAIRALAVLGGLALVGLGVVGTPMSAAAATLTVDSTLDSGPGTLRDVIASASAGDTIDFNLPDPSTITLDSTITLPEGVTISGPGQSALTIDIPLGGFVAGFLLLPTSPGQDYTFSGLTLDGESLLDGVAIGDAPANQTPRNVELTDVTVKNTSGPEGTALDFTGLSGTLDIENSSFTNDAALGAGGAIKVFDTSGPVTLTQDYFEGNSAGQGGALWVSGAPSVSLDATEFDGNSATEDAGGGVYIANVSGPISLTDGCGIRGNFAEKDGGGVYLDADPGGLTVSDSLFDGNTNGVRDPDGGVIVEGDGAGLAVATASGTTTVSTTRFTNNSAPQGIGGGIFLGGVGADGSLSVTDSSFTGNEEFFGGAVYAGEVETAAGVGVDIESSTFSANTTGKGGTAGTSIAVQGTSAPVRVVNSTIDEEAVGLGELPVVWVQDAAPASARTTVVTLESDTINGSGAVALASFTRGKVLIANTILQTRTAADPSLQLFGVPSGTVSLDHDLVTTAKISGIHDLGGNRFSVSSMGLGALADNGGPTETRLPALTSPAHNAGRNSDAPPSGFDQRGAGFPRVVQTIDIGAVEIQTLTAVPTLPTTGASIPIWLPVGGAVLAAVGLLFVLVGRTRRAAQR